VKDDSITIRVSEDEFALLEEARAKDRGLAAVFELGHSQDHRSIHVSPKNVEEIRDFLTLELAVTGFDRDYAPNRKGLLIENLIDKLFIP
jgi:hypothetical protein